MAWSQFVWLFLVVTTEDMTTIPVGITQVNDAIGGFYARLMSVALPGASRLLSPLWSPGKMAEALMISSGIKDYDGVSLSSLPD